MHFLIPGELCPYLSHWIEKLWLLNFHKFFGQKVCETSDSYSFQTGFWILWISSKLTKVYLFLKKCLHDLQFIETRSYSPNLSKLSLSGISWRPCFHKLKKKTVYRMNIRHWFILQSFWRNTTTKKM